MLTDIGTVIWKEIHELLSRQAGARGSLRGGLLSIVVFLAAFGVFLPLNAGPAWVSSPTMLVYWAWVPMLMVSSVVADSFAGERERHTLETLLASRLPDRAILLGKVLATIAYGWGFTLAAVLIGLLSLNLTHLGGPPLLYPPLIFAAIVLVSLLESALASSAGVLVSLRSGSVRQAQQTLSLALLVLVPSFAIRSLPEATRQTVSLSLAGLSASSALALLCGLLLLVDAALLLAGAARFRRSHLLLD